MHVPYYHYVIEMMKSKVVSFNPSTEIAMRAFREVGKKIIGVRHNFHSRIAELGIATPTEPELYLKSFTSIVTQPNPIHIPLDHEVEHQGLR